MQTQLSVRRVYEGRARTDGLRILVDRLWPRGLRKDAAALDYWLKEVAPSPGLRTWFAHRADRFDQFRQDYLSELASNEAVSQLEAIVFGHAATLLYAARDPAINHAVVLRDYLLKELRHQKARHL